MNKNRKMIRRLLTATLAAGMLLSSGGSAVMAASTSNEISERETRNATLSMTAATQGMVLLENNNNALPIASSGSIALFGGGAVKTVKGGTGSGDVNKRYTVSVKEGLENAGYQITSSAWLDAYSTAYDEGEAAFNGGWNEHFIMTEPLLTEEDIAAAQADGTDTAIYVISRNSGEGADRTETEGDYYLMEEEKANLATLGKSFEKVIVVLNVGGVIDTNFFHEIEGLDAMLLMSQAGMEGGTAVTKVLNGEVTPSGKLTDTWPAAYTDYPTAETFGANDGNIDQEDYTSGIYVGYRYFDSFGIAPAYAFGYGLSYTSFDIAVDAVTADSEKVTVTATVTNTGDTYSGKEVVEVYFSAPDGELEKPYQELAAYGKTDELAPGESQMLTISYATSEMSSYSEEKAAYLLEGGDYVVRVGNSSRSTTAAAIINLDETVITEQLSNQLAVDKELEELSTEGAVPYTYDGEAEEIASAELISLSASDIETVNNVSTFDDETVTAYVSDTTETEYLAENLGYELENKYHGTYTEEVVEFDGDYSQCTLKDVYDGTITMEQFVSGLKVSEMADLVIGGNKLPTASGQSAGAVSENAETMLTDGTMIGAQANSVDGAAGETAGLYIETKKIPNIVLADGPAGLRITQEYEGTDGETYYQFCTAWPVGTLLAQTWDPEVVEAFGTAFGEELEEYGVTVILAPGMNIHLNALCGRNFEYYSEDPYLTGTIGIAETTGVQSNEGVGVSIKHYAANSQEANRNAVNNTINERAFREIYLKAFEMVVKGAQPMTIMSSYNLNNSVPAGDDYDLLTDIARGEWGFDGFVMTDWGGGQSTPSLSMHAGNDLIMPGNSVEDITIRAFADQEPEFDEDDIYPVITLGESWGFPTATEEWGELKLDSQGDVQIVKTVDTAVYEAAVRETVVNDELVTLPVAELLANLGDGVTVEEGTDGKTTITYTGYYNDNNICLGDLQKSVINLLNVIMQTSQFADMFDDVEAPKYTEMRTSELVSYIMNEKLEIR